MRAKLRAHFAALKSKTKVKHIVDWTDLLTTGNTTQNHVIANATDNPIQANVSDVATGSQIFNLLMQINFGCVASSTTGPIRVDWYIMFNPQGKYTTFADPTTLGTADQKSVVFKQGMEMVSAGTPMVLKGLIKIPRKWQKMMKSDQFVLVYRFSDNTANNVSHCGHFLYREYR